MLTTLMILSPDQGKISKAAPRFDRRDERRMSEIDFDPGTARSDADKALVLQRSPRWRTAGFTRLRRA